MKNSTFMAICGISLAVIALAVDGAAGVGIAKAALSCCLVAVICHTIEIK